MTLRFCMPLLAGLVIGCASYVPDPRNAPAESPSSGEHEDETQHERREREELQDLRELASREDAEVTKRLIDIVMDPTRSSAIADEAERLLATRRSGVEHMLVALDAPRELLSGAPHVPVGALADALATLDEKRAAPALARFLSDPGVSPDELERVANALVQLASADQTRDLEIFVELNRTTASDAATTRAVVAAFKALDRLNAHTTQELISRALADPLTRGEIRRALETFDRENGMVAPL